MPLQHGNHGSNCIGDFRQFNHPGCKCSFEGTQEIGDRTAGNTLAFSTPAQHDNLHRGGAVILPAMPGFYHKPTSVDDIVDFIVARVCDQIGVDHNLQKRWGQNEGD